MKNLIFLLFCSISINCFSQTSLEQDSINDTLEVVNFQVEEIDSIKFFQYRISFNEIKTVSASKDIQSEMFDIFKSQITFNETLNQFIFVSSTDIDRFYLHRAFDRYQIESFKKLPITY